MVKLTRHSQFTTDNMNDACRHMGRLLHRRIDLLDHQPGSRFTMATAMLRLMAVHAFEITGHIKIRSHADGIIYTLFRMEEDGRAERLEDGQPPLVIGPGQGVLTAPESRSVTEWTGGCVAFCIPTGMVQLAIHHLIKQWITQPIETLEIINLRGSYLGQAIDFFLEQLELPDGGVFERLPLHGYRMQHDLVHSMVFWLQHNLQPLLMKHYGGYARRHMDKLEEFLSVSGSDPKMNAKIMAKSIGVSERTLRNSCNRIYQEGPDDFLRHRRLFNAYQRLEHPLPGDTVPIVAQAVGFTNLRGFIKHYKAAYREHPGETHERGLAKTKRR
jgi:AraC-like DNA-binding protein